MGTKGYRVQVDIWVETEIRDILARMGFKDFKGSGVLKVL